MVKRVTAIIPQAALLAQLIVIGISMAALLALPQRASAQTFAWVSGGEFGAAAMADPEEDCRLIAAEVGSALTLNCATDHNMSFWSLDTGVVIARFLTARAGYLDIGTAALLASATGSNTIVEIEGTFGRTRGVTLMGGLRFPVGRVVPFVEAGVWRWSATTTTRVTITRPGAASSELNLDDDSSWDPLIRAGVDVWVTDNVGVSGSFRWVRAQSGRTGDLTGADERFTMWSGGIAFRLP